MKTYITISKKYKLHFFDVFLISWIIANLIVLILSKKDSSIDLTSWNSSILINYTFLNFFYISIIPLLSRFIVSDYFGILNRINLIYFQKKELEGKIILHKNRNKLKSSKWTFKYNFFNVINIIFQFKILILWLLLWVSCIVVVFKIGFFINDHYWSQPLILLYDILYIIVAILIIISYFGFLESESTKYDRLYKIFEIKLAKIDKKIEKNKEHNIKDQFQNKIESYLFKYTNFIKNSKSYPINKDDWDELNNEQVTLELSDKIVLEVKWYYLKNLKRKYCNWFVFSSIGACFFSPLNDKMPILTITIASIGMIYCFYFNYTLYDHKWNFVKIKYVKYKFIPLLYIIIVSIISIAYSKSELHKTIEEIHTVILSLIGILAMILSFFS